MFPGVDGGIEICYQNLLVFGIDYGNFVPGMDIDVVFFLERFRPSYDECLFPVNQTGDKIGNTSGGKGCVGAALKNGYTHIGFQPADLCCSTHSGSITAYYGKHCLHLVS